MWTSVPTEGQTRIKLQQASQNTQTQIKHWFKGAEGSAMKSNCSKPCKVQIALEVLRLIRKLLCATQYQTIFIMMMMMMMMMLMMVVVMMMKPS